MIALLRDANRSMSNFQNGSVNNVNASTGELRVLDLVGSFTLPTA